MGSYNYAALVPFKLNVGDQPLHEDIATMIAGYDGHLGWQLLSESDDVPGKGDELFGRSFKKDDHIVFLINEDQYAAGGAVDDSFIAATEEALEQFKQDFELEGEIEADVIAKQTL